MKAHKEALYKVLSVVSADKSANHRDEGRDCENATLHAVPNSPPYMAKMTDKAKCVNFRLFMETGRYSEMSEPESTSQTHFMTAHVVESSEKLGNEAVMAKVTAMYI